MSSFAFYILMEKFMANLKCPQCGYEAKDENDKREHMRKNHGSGATESNE